jgi:Thioredoxin domain-containing protein
MSPTIEKVSDERPDIKVGKVNVDEQPELARRFAVAGIPSLVVLRQGKVVSQTTGARPKNQVLALLD